MIKSVQEQLEALKRSNKVRREQVAIKNGYSDYASYKAYLEGQINVTVNVNVTVNSPVKPPVVHNVHILDCSGSMNDRNKIGVALNGINEEIETLANSNDGDYIQTVVVFNLSHKTIFSRVPIKQIFSKISVNAYGGTALYQTVGETLEKLLREKDPDEKVLVKIFTDGEENSSRGKYRDSRELFNLIEECQSKGFTITFVGTDRDVNRIVNAVGIDISNTLSHNNTPDDIKRVYAQTISATTAYRSAVNDGLDVTKGFYKREGTL